MQIPQRLRLRTQYLLFFVGAAVIPLVVLGLIEWTNAQRLLPKQEQAALQKDLRLAQLLSRNLRYELNLVLDPIQKGAPQIALERRSRPDQNAALGRLMSTTPLLQHLFLVDEQRRVIASAKPTLWIGQTLPEAIFPLDLAQGPVYYSPVFRSAEDGAPLAAISYAYPSFKKGALVCLLDLNALLADQLQNQPDQREQLYLIDQTGQPLVEPDRRRGAMDLRALPPVKAVLAGKTGTLKFQTIREGQTENQLAAHVPIAGTGWGVVVSETEEAALGDLLSRLGAFGIGLAITSLGAFGFAFWLSEAISQPLQRIIEGMQRLATRSSVPQEVFSASVLELQILIDAFTTMRQRIGAETQANQELLENLAAEKLKLELVLASITEGILVYGLEGQIITANPAFQQLLNLPAASLTTWKMLPLCNVLGERVPIEETVLYRAITKGPQHALNRIDDRNGKPCIIQTTAAPLKSAEGIVLGGVAIISDVTLQKESERLREDFVATLTHDLRTPLLAAVQALDFTLQGQYGTVSARQAQVLEAVAQSQRELMELVECLLTIYRYEAGRMNLRKEPTDLLVLAQNCIQKVQPLADARNLSLFLEPGSGLPLVMADPQQIRRVIVNLMDNALKFTPAGGTVRITLTQLEQRVVLAVWDTGLGIPPERLEQIFVRFTQGRNHGTGTGLGLYLCRQIIEAHGGRIWVESKPSLGSTFQFDLPVVERP